MTIVMSDEPNARIFREMVEDAIHMAKQGEGLSEQQALLVLAMVLQHRLSVDTDAAPHSSALEWLMRAVVGTLTGRQAEEEEWRTYLLNKLENGYSRLKDELEALGRPTTQQPLCEVDRRTHFAGC